MSLSDPQARDNRIDLIRPDSPELTPHGPHQIGVQTLRFTDLGRPDVLNSLQELQTHDRTLTVELWYPAVLPAGAHAGEAYHTVTVNGQTPAVLHGRATRNAAPEQGRYPLILISHGYPGNRYLMLHLAENLTSKGYVVAAIDHTESTYSDLAHFASTLVNRPLDQLFVLQALADLDQSDHPLAGHIDTDHVGLFGYSMGGYGVLNVVGAGFSDAAVQAPEAPPHNLMYPRAHSNPEYHQSMDPRIKAAVAVTPWGYNFGLWAPEAFASIKVPLFLIGGDQDDIAGYDNGVKAIFNHATGAERHLLTFLNGGHNIAAPIPAPVETWNSPSDFKHYADPVWDTVRMNNITQHFLTAFYGLHLKGQAEMQEYLDSTEGFKGFSNSGKTGLKLEAGHPTE